MPDRPRPKRRKGGSRREGDKSADHHDDNQYASPSYPLQDIPEAGYNPTVASEYDAYNTTDFQHQHTGYEYDHTTDSPQWHDQHTLDQANYPPGFFSSQNEGPFPESYGQRGSVPPHVPVETSNEPAWARDIPSMGNFSVTQSKDELDPMPDANVWPATDNFQENQNQTEEGLLESAADPDRDYREERSEKGKGKQINSRSFNRSTENLDDQDSFDQGDYPEVDDEPPYGQNIESSYHRSSHKKQPSEDFVAVHPGDYPTGENITSYSPTDDEPQRETMSEYEDQSLSAAMSAMNLKQHSYEEETSFATRRMKFRHFDKKMEGKAERGVLDPSCGSGNLICYEVLKHIGYHQRYSECEGIATTFGGEYSVFGTIKLKWTDYDCRKEESSKENTFLVINPREEETHFTVLLGEEWVNNNTSPQAMEPEPAVAEGSSRRPKDKRKKHHR